MAWSTSISCLGPAFLVYVGCMDPGKWATALEGGSRFGFELIWVVILSCFFAASLRSLAARLGLATGQNLAQICHDQYPGYLSVLLWLHSEVSILILDVTMVLGNAMTLHALLGISVVSSVILTAAASVLFHVVLRQLGLYKVELLTASIMGVVLLCFSVEALHSSGPITSTIFHGLTPKLKGDTLYIAAGILGANIIPSSFYLHSALVQDERHTVNFKPDALLHHSIVDIATGTGVMLLVNLSVLSAAAAAFHNSGHVVITLQDAQALMEQVLSNSVAPAAFGFALLCGGLLSSFSLTVAGQVATEGFLGLKLPSSFHQIFTRLGAILTALCLLWNFGSEGMYQVLVFSQVILALQLPLVIVPLVKFTSSLGIMGCLKHSRVAESILWTCTGLLYFVNVWVAFDMFSGESEEYVGSGSWSLIRGFNSAISNWGEGNRSFCLIILAGVTTFYTSLLLWMISTPLKADRTKLSSGAVSNLMESLSRHSDESLKEDAVERNVSSYNTLDSYILADDMSAKHHEHVADSVTSLPYEPCMEHLKAGAELSVTENVTESIKEDPFNELAGLSGKQALEGEETQAARNLEVVESCAAISETKELSPEPSQKESEQQSVFESTISTDDHPVVDFPSSSNSFSKENVVSLESPASELKTTVTDITLEPTTPVTEAAAEEVHLGIIADALKGTVDDIDLELLDNNDFDIDGWETLDQDDTLQDSLSVLGGSVSSLTFEEPGSGRSFSARSDASEGSCGGSGSGSLSRLSGLGRSARKQFAALLDEFWGKLYDLHGQPVSQTHGKSRGPSSKISQVDSPQQLSSSAYREAFGPSSTWYTSKLAQKSWQTSVKGDVAGQSDAYLQSPYNGAISESFGGKDSYLQKHSALDVNEKRYSSLRYPSFRDSFDNQPATIHGYKMASYVGRNGSLPTGVDASTFILERQRQVTQRGSFDEQSSPIYRHSALDPSEIENSLSSNSIQSYLASSYAKPTRDRQFENFALANGSFTTHSNRSADPYLRPQWTSYTGRDSATWDPLVYRATGELDMSQYDQLGLQKERDSLKSSFMLQQTNERGYRGPSLSSSTQFKSQIDRCPLSFDDLSPSQTRKDAFSIQTASQNQSLWATQPFELFGSARAATPIGSGRMATRNATGKGLGQNGTHGIPRNMQTPVGNDHDIEILNRLRLCIRKLLKLDGSEWLFRLESGSDEDLIATVSVRERVLLEADIRELQKLHTGNDPLWAASSPRPNSNSDLAFLTLGSSGVPHCGEGCVWSAELLTSFGVWCIHRVLELALMESRPELWGKYTYVLNRLQGVLDPAFSKPRMVHMSCICLTSETSEGQGRSLKNGGTGDVLSRSLSGGFPGNAYQGYPQCWPWGRNSSTGKGKGASASIFLEIIKDVETAIGTRKGRTGTAAGDVAFPKGKENLASVLKRYKRRLANKSPGTPNNNGNNSANRRAPLSSPSIFG